MYYCQKCHLLNEKNCCAKCDNENLREVKSDDYCFLTEKEMMWCEMLREILDNYDIPYIYESANGAAMGLNMGVAIERYKLFVPFAYYEQASQIIDHMFNEK